VNWKNYIKVYIVIIYLIYLALRKKEYRNVSKRN
jgi:hypothetical protein